MPKLIFIFNDQLSKSLTALTHVDKKQDVILFVETVDQYTVVKHHQKKIAFLMSAMRHFANELIDDGYQVAYITLDAKDNSGDLNTEIEKVIKRYQFKSLTITKPSDYYLLKQVEKWPKHFNIKVTLLEDDRFLCSVQQFAAWAANKKQLRMEFFYRWMRKRHNILMKDAKPEGGQWNYDTQNRKVPKNDISIPKPTHFNADAISKKCIALVKQYFSDHFGDLEPFYLAVTREQALQVLHQFIKQRLTLFGDYQDAMLESEAWLFHSHISFYLNCGLLLAEECIELAEKAYKENKAPLNAVEGFIRQILGWREYVRGIYWLKMPDYASQNYLKAKRPLPSFYWDANTDMNCLKQCISETKQHAYAHHIQRLMVLGNFALLMGINPSEVNEWYWIVYADAYQWVELPNVTGMVLFADGGVIASKPYAASGAYIHKMSNYCKNCHYNVKEKIGAQACPFNYLYWHFIDEHQQTFRANPRMSFVYNTYDKMSDEKKQAIKKSSQQFISALYNKQ